MKIHLSLILISLLFLISTGGVLHAKRYDPNDPAILRQKFRPNQFELNTCHFEHFPCPEDEEPTPEPTPEATPSPTPEATESPDPSDDPEGDSENDIPTLEDSEDDFFPDESDPIDVFTTESGGCSLGGVLNSTSPHFSIWIWMGIYLVLPVLRRLKGR